MEFIKQEIQNYSEEHTSAQSDLLNRVDRETHVEVLKSRMLSGHLQGRVLAMFSHMIQPKRVLEIGTYTGFSALCLAEGLHEDGKIYTIDVNEELEERVEGYIKDAGLKDKIVHLIGNAHDIVPDLKEEWDLVFIDADKTNYQSYYETLIPRLRSGGVIIADNVLWSGKVIGWHKKNTDKDTLAIKAFNTFVNEDDRVENVLMPIRDGLMVVRKK